MKKGMIKGSIFGLIIALLFNPFNVNAATVSFSVLGAQLNGLNGQGLSWNADPNNIISNGSIGGMKAVGFKNTWKQTNSTGLLVALSNTGNFTNQVNDYFAYINFTFTQDVVNNASVSVYLNNSACTLEPTNLQTSNTYSYTFAMSCLAVEGNPTDLIVGTNIMPLFDYFVISSQFSYKASTADSIQQQIIVEQQETNKKIEELNKNQEETNDLINSDSEDTESGSCGIICKLKGIFTGIIELPSKLVGLLIDALKSLFVPTDNQLYEIINDSKDLAENFGFIGESVNFFITIFTSLLGMVNANGCIELPEFTIGETSLFKSFTFWQAQNVCLNDNVILSRNIDTIRTITSIVLVGLFINFASSKFFNILSKNDSESESISYDPRTGEVRE